MTPPSPRENAEALDARIFECPGRFLRSAVFADAVAGDRPIGAVDHLVHVDEPLAAVPRPSSRSANSSIEIPVPRAILSTVRKPGSRRAPVSICDRDAED